MLSRPSIMVLSDAYDEMICYMCIVIVASNGGADTASARKFLEAADKTNDKMVFFNVFRYVYTKSG